MPPTKSPSAARPRSSAIVETTPRGLFIARYTSLGLVATRSPSTEISAASGSTLSPSVATCPSTVTRPAAISSSQARREPTPAAASTFCSRSGLGISDLVHVVGQERCERRKLVEAVQAELFQEQRGGPVQERPGLRLAAALLDQPAADQRAYHAVAVDAANRRDARPGHRLLVR